MKLKVKIGSAEFEAEGDEVIVNAQYEAFLKTVQSAPQPPAIAQAAPTPQAPQVPPAGVSGDLDLGRVFDVSKEGVVSLKRQPTGENQKANAIVLLLYGYRVLTKEDMVLANRVTRGMEISGMKIERVDRFVNTIGRFLTQGGTRSGSRYGLNNPGIQHAEDLIRDLLS